MNQQEARKVLKIMACTDCRCKHCASILFDMFIKEFPELEITTIEAWKEEFLDDPELLAG